MATAPKPKKHYFKILILILGLVFLGTYLGEPRLLYSAKNDLQDELQIFLQNKRKSADKKTKKGENPEAIAACQAYIKEVNKAIQKYAKDHPNKPYPWRDYNDMIDADDPSLVPQYLTVIRGCLEEGTYSYDPASHTIKCSFPKHNP